MDTESQKEKEKEKEEGVESEKFWNLYGKKTSKLSTEKKREKNLPLKDKKKNNVASGAAAKKFVKPTIDEIAAYCKERKNSINASTFFNHYESVGWKVGKSPMKSWRACVHTWENRDKEKNEPEQKTKLTGNFFR